ncbi:putative peroxisomal membrane protein [Patellaria atrata CBS 101060]|uniref:Peroxisomal membrane protein n=1 Tax=Patellaria atrata CBS 101060 TaxID=1346257 RepID=A0A9P4VRY8_9PEZI|nr:putative peroxisomal membrane protein [Patellaria atrata CBS 101060]
MIKATRNWIRRNRTNFAVGAGVLGVGYIAGQYVLGKITETRQRMSDDRIAKENLRRRFQNNQEDCTHTVLAIVGRAAEEIVTALPVEQTVAELQKQKAERLAKSARQLDQGASDTPSGSVSAAEDDGRSLASFQTESYVHASQVGDATSTPGGEEGPRLRKSKAQLWSEMKISSITRTFTLIYTLCLLTLFTRIQLNLLGRRNYLASVVLLATPQPQGTINLENNDDDNFEHAYGNDYQTNREYLSYCWWLLHRGCKDIMEKVKKAVKEVFGPLDPREDITLERLSELTLEARKKIEGVTEEERKSQRWLHYLLPPQDREEYVLREAGMLSPSAPSTVTSPSLRRLLDETSDLIDSPSFSYVQTLLLDAAFSLLIDTKMASLAFKIPPISASTARVQEIVGSDTKTKVANTLAIFTRQAHSIGSSGPNEYLTAIEGVRDLEAFSAVIFSSNFDYESPEAGAGVEGLEASRPGTAGTEKPEEPRSTSGGDASLVGAESQFESAWGKALAKEDGMS